MIIHPIIFINDNPFVFRDYFLLLYKLNILNFVYCLILMIKFKLCRCMHANYHSPKADSDD